MEAGLVVLAAGLAGLVAGLAVVAAGLAGLVAGLAAVAAAAVVVLAVGPTVLIRLVPRESRDPACFLASWS